MDSHGFGDASQRISLNRIDVNDFDPIGSELLLKGRQRCYYRFVMGQLVLVSLYLIGIAFYRHGPHPLPEEILGFSIPESGVLMKGFSGQLYHPTGEYFGSQMATYKPQTTEELMFDFKAGKLISKMLLETKPSAERIMERVEKDIQDLTAVLEEIRTKASPPEAVPQPPSK